MTHIFTTDFQASTVRQRTYEGLKQEHSKSLQTDGKEGNYSDVEDVRLFISGEVQLASATAEVSDNNYLREFSKSATSVLQRASSVNDRLNALLRETRNSNIAPAISFQEKITDLLTELTTALNTPFINECTMSGTRTNKNAVVDLAALPGLAPGAVIDTAYYMGDQKQATLAVDDSYQITLFSVNASHDCIRKTVGALRLCLTANPDDPADLAMTAAMDLSNEAQKKDFPDAISLSTFATRTLTSANADAEKLKEQLNQRIVETGFKSSTEALAAFSLAEALSKVSQHLTMQEAQSLKEFVRSLG